MIYLGFEYHEVYGSCLNGFCLLMHLYIVYGLTLLFFFILDDKVKKISIIPVAVICLWESFIGIKQLLGYQSSNHILYAVTGSFQNPGPYGGYIAVCISLIVAYCAREWKSYKRTKISMLMFWLAFVAAAAGVIILPSAHSRSSVVSLGFSMMLLAWGTESIRERVKPMLKKYGILILLGVTMLGAGAYYLKKPSADGRIFMDRISFKAMCSNGLKGVGAGHFGGAYGRTQAQYFKSKIEENGTYDLDWKAINEHERLTADCPDNSFNEYLTFGVEEGPFLMIIMVSLIIAAIMISYRRGTMWCYGLVTLSVFACFSYPLHIRQFQIMLMILMAACVSDGQNDDHKRKWIEWVVTGVALVTVFLVLVPEIPMIRQYREVNKAWKKVQYWHIHEYYEYAVEDCEKLFPYLQNDYSFLFAYGQSLNKIGLYEKSDTVLMMGSEMSSDPMFWNVMGNNSAALGRYHEAEERYKQSFYMVPNRIYPLCLLAKLYLMEGDTVGFYGMAEKIETFKAKVESGNAAVLRSEISDLKNGLMEKLDVTDD